MKVLVVSGIWPPDVGGPASHGPDVARFLHRRGHGVEVVVTASAEPAEEPFPVYWAGRSRPVGIRHADALALVCRHARRADVVYSTGMYGRSGIACALARRPLVVKVTGDPAFERLRARGSVDGDVDAFQERGGGITARGLRQLRDRVLRRAAHVFTPSGYLRELVIAWGVAPERVSVMPNAAPSGGPSAPREELRRRFGCDGPTLAFAGRLTAQKSLDVMLDAVAATPGVALVVAGDGEERDALLAGIAGRGLDDRVRTLGRLPRTDVLDLFAAADASVLSSSWENFPHSVVESLAVGTPVIATRAGGVVEVVEDGVNGLLVPVGDAVALAAAIRRFFADEGLRDTAARERGRLGLSLRDRPTSGRAGTHPRGGGPMRPRVLFVARTRYALPLDPTLQRRFDALSAVLDWHQLGTSATGKALRDDRFTLVGRFPVAALDGAAFYGALPARAARAIRSFRPDCVIVQGAQDTALALAARRLAGSRVPVVLDVHGDWRHDTRVYGSPARRLLSPAVDRLADFAVRHADGVRTVSGFTSSLVRARGVEPTATFPAYMDLAPFLETAPLPLPVQARVLFVGVLERYKAVDVLAKAWREVAARLPAAELRIVGIGPLEDVVAALAAEPGLGVSWTPRLATAEVARALDESTLLVLPSRGEGMGRVVVEAFCRARPVVGTDAGGIPDLVEHEVSGLLVPPDDACALAAALELVLSDRELATRLGSGAHAAARAWSASPEEFAARTRDLVDLVIAGARSRRPH